MSKQVESSSEKFVVETASKGKPPAEKVAKTPVAAANTTVDTAPIVQQANENKPEKTSTELSTSTAAMTEDLENPELYLNRELTWLNFNRRVLNEAADRRNPLLERLKFVAIAGSNLDEFFMKRIGGLKQQLATNVHTLTVDGRTPAQQIKECTDDVQKFREDLRKTYLELVRALQSKGIVIASYDKLTQAQKAEARQQYLDNVLPLVTPLAMDPAHPFPFISNLSLNLLVTLRYRDDEEPVMNRIKVPVGYGVSRFLRIGKGRCFVPLEDVMANNLDLLFPEMEVESCEFFRVTRNANTEIDEEQADDLLIMIESELRYRKFAPFVRLEIDSRMMPLHRGMLAAELGLNEETDVFEADIILGLGHLMEIASLDIPRLHDDDHHPITNTKLQDSRNIFHVIRESGSILLQFPYESFATSVERFVREASRDPKVVALKMTLYRTSADTEILEYLIDAARNGKQVAVAVELKARFDEAANIRWANRLEEAGIHVTYGVVGLKLDGDNFLAERARAGLSMLREHEQNAHAFAPLCRAVFPGFYVQPCKRSLRRYAHLGTGNYHAGTARIYSDFGLLTCDDEIGHDLTELFNYLTSGCKPSRKYLKLLTAPKFLKKAILAKIDREIEVHSKSSPGLIRLKTNALEDADVTAALYKASAAGVKVELVVRDTCRLRPGLPGVSENITVISVVSRFLEHARIYYFRNGGDEEYYIGSADLMRRNLESRVEILVPVLDPAHREELKFFLDVQLADTRSAWEMQPDGSYVQRQPKGRGPATVGSQQTFIEAAEKREVAANRLRRRKPRAIARRSVR